jgi:o-succinylbenzoate---CoA ligase
VLAAADLRPGDLIAVRLSPGPRWPALIATVWDAGAAVLPLDVRMPPGESEAVLRRAEPTVILEETGWWRPDDGLPAEGEVVAVIHTSGTGGAPKLVAFDRRAIDAAVASSSLALESGPEDAWLCCLPLAHVGGLLVLLRAVLLGAPVAVHPRFDVDAIAAEADVAFISVVPSMLRRLLDAGVDLARFRRILVGGAALSRQLRGRAEAAGGNVVETYGLTESCGGVVYDGRPLPGTSVRIDSETRGIELRGPTLMRGYRADAASTSVAFTRDGWLRSGDAGRFDGEGRLHVLGRLDDVINTGGEKVWPQEVESAVSTHPTVADVAVAGRPDAEWGERVVAYVVPTDRAAPPSLADLRDHAASTIARFKAPHELVIVDELPRTASGKVRRGALAESP